MNDAAQPTPEQQEALNLFWGARTPEEKQAAYKALQAVGVDLFTTEVADMAATSALSILSVEPVTLKLLVKGLATLQRAAQFTDNGLASDHCENAAREIRKAMRLVGG